MRAVVAVSPESMVPGGPAERRPAIWPWLVMPLVTLALFFALNRLHQMTPAEQTFDSGPQTPASSPVDSTSP
ncbi:MAG TPA: hypothetical protein VFO44_01785 [Steroidobacteraceae bacterium]|nr:hypothetical protein [Steroidobacteraceae bacterium]